MLEKIIEYSIKNKFLVILATVFVIGAGWYAMLKIPKDAIPDLSDVQVIIFTEYPGQAPQVVEDQVTYPLTTTMLSVPYSKVVRGYSFFGFSFVYIIFEDGTDMYWARSRVLEYLSFVSKQLPKSVTPTLGPDATGVGWVYEYILESDRHNLQELRSIQDWYLRYGLLSTQGVSEVAAIGGYVKQYQVEVDPNKLLAYNIPLHKVKMAIKRSNNDVGGRLIEMSEMEFMVRGLGYIKSIEDIKNIPVGVDKNGTPILIKNIANVHLGPELRRGVTDWNGEGEVVAGIVIMRYGENALEVIDNVKKKLEELKTGLPEGVKIKTAYDRSMLIERAIDNLKDKLIEEGIVVSVVIMLFLLHLPSAFVAIFTLPVGVLIAFLVMFKQGLNSNIMSLGGIAIAIGAMVDAAIVMVENAHKHLEHDQGKKDRWVIVTEASKEVGPALFYSLLIITLSFLPVFTLEAQEGRLFKPLAFTKTYSMAAAAFLSITIVPIFIGFFIRGKIKPENKNPVNRILNFFFLPMLRVVLSFRWLVLVIAFGLLVSMAYPFKNIGSEFLPPLNEGDLLYMPTTLPGISITKAKELLQQTDRIIKTFPEVHHVFGKIGRATTATDPAPLSMMETTIMLEPEEKWRKGMTIDKLIKEMNGAIKFPGVTNAWTMPIKTRIDMLATGIKTPVGIKVMGNDLDVLNKLGEEIEGVVGEIPGTLSVYSERVIGGNYLDFKIDRLGAARYGLTVGDVQDVIISAIGGMNVTETVEGLERYPVNVRYGRDLRSDLTALRRVLIPTPTGTQIPISQVAKINIHKGPPGIKTENALKNAWIYVDLKDIDVGTYVKRAQKIVEEKIKFPEGYFIVWSGQYEYMQRAQERLKIVLPVTLVIIFVLLYLNFQSVIEAVILMATIPFSLVGGMWLLYFLDYNLSVAVAVGMIALAGVATEIGVLVFTFIDHEYIDIRSKKQGPVDENDLMDAAIHGTSKRLRPIVMTAMAILCGLLPIMWAHGAGSKIMKRIAAPMVGGIVSATILSLFVLPIVWYIWKKIELFFETRKLNKTEAIENV